MRHERRVSENNKMRVLIIGVIILVVGVYHTTTSFIPKQIVGTQENDIEYKTFVYTITHTDGTEYYGKAHDGTGIYFTSDKLESDEMIHENDLVRAFFEPENLVEMVKVQKVNY